MQQNSSIAELFGAMGYNWEKMEINAQIDVSNLGFKIRSFSLSKKKDEFKLVTKIIRKSNSVGFKITSGSDELVSSGDHRLFVTLGDVEDLHEVEVSELYKIPDRFYLWNGNNLEKFTIEKQPFEVPILDLEIEENHNYYSENMLSHNTIFGSPEAIGVGNALKFYASMRIDLRRKEQHKGPGDIILGNHLNAKIIKNKLAPPFRQAEYDIYFDTCFDLEGSGLKPGLECGVIERTGTWFSFEGERVANGSKNFGPYMKEHPEVYERLLKAISNNIPKEISSTVTLNEESGELE